MDLQGKIIKALEPRSGTSARGEWTAQDFVVETHDAYPRKMVFSVWGADRLQRFNIQEGQEVMVSFDIDAHEYQGRWFNSVRAFDVRLVDPSTIQSAQPFPPAQTGAAPAGQTTQTAATTPFPPAQQENENNADDLPF